MSLEKLSCPKIEMDSCRADLLRDGHPFYSRAALTPLVALAALGASQCSRAVRPDALPALAVESNDKTVVIDGCGNQPAVGFTYCRKREGDPTTGTLTLYAPPTRCRTAPCASFLLFFPDGSPSLGFEMKSGQTSQKVEWRELTKSDSFQKDMRGFWPVLLKWKWISDQDGQEYESIAEGEIRLRVLARDYLPLDAVKWDPNFAWKWSDGAHVFAMTTASRAAAWKSSP